MWKRILKIMTFQLFAKTASAKKNVRTSESPSWMRKITMKRKTIETEMIVNKMMMKKTATGKRKKMKK